MTKKRIALITVWYPPAQSIAVSRMLSFAKYLSDVFEVDVYTLGDSNQQVKAEHGMVYYAQSPSLLDHFKHKGGEPKLIHHFKSVVNLVARKLNITTLGKWQSTTLKTLKANHQSSAYDAIISSYAPIEPHDIALSFKKQHPSVFWLADMRDGMSKNPYLSESEQNKLALKEAEYRNYVSAISSVSAPILEEFKAIFPDLKNLWEIRNGYDHTIQVNRNFNEIFTMVFAGTFYGKRKPDNFLKVLSRFAAKQGKDFKFKLLFIGTHHNFSVPSEIIDSVEFIPKVPYLKAIEYMSNADCNLMISPPVNAMGQFTGKLFDYLSVEKPVLALMDKRDVGAKLIEEHGAGFVAEFDDEKETEAGLEFIYTLWKKRESLSIDPDKTKSLHRKYQVQKLAENLTKNIGR